MLNIEDIFIVRNKNSDLYIMSFIFRLMILYIILPYFIRFISGIVFFKLPIAIGLILSSYIVGLLTLAKKTIKLPNKYFFFLLFQLFVWSYFIISLLFNAIINSYPINYVLASTISYVLTPIFVLLFVVFSLNSIKTRKGNDFFFLSFFLFIIFITAFFENLIFYTKGSAFFETLKGNHLIMSYYVSILGEKFLKTFSVFSSGLEFGFLSLLLYIFIGSPVKKAKKYKFFIMLLKFFSLLGIILSFTRIVWMTFILYYLLILLRKYILKLSSIFFIQLFLNIIIYATIYYSILYIQKFDIYFVSSIITRFNSWREILLFIKNKFYYLNYLFGHGLSQTEIWHPFTSTEYKVFCIDNTLLNLFLLGGFFGAFIFFINYYVLLSKLINIYKKQTKQNVFKLIVLWILFPIIMNFNVLVPSVLFIFLYASSNYVIGLYYNWEITYEKNIYSNSQLEFLARHN